MPRRHTATSPEQRQLPHDGRTRIAVRLAYVGQVIDDKTGELVYEEIKDEEGNIIQQRANRAIRRRIAWGTRLHGAPRMRLPVREVKKAVEATVTDDDLFAGDEALRKLGVL